MFVVNLMDNMDVHSLMNIYTHIIHHKDMDVTVSIDLNSFFKVN